MSAAKIARRAARAFCTTSDGHPLVDCSALSRRAGPARAAAVSEIGAALREVGYFYAASVDELPADYIASVYDYSARAHALPPAVKRRFAQKTGGGGSYSGADIGEEHRELAYEAGTISTVRAWDYSRERFSLADKNAFPGADVIEPPFEEFVDELYARQNTLARTLMVAFAEALELPKATFASMFDGAGEGDYGTIRLLSYPGEAALSAEEAAAASVGISAHTDFEAFTLMHQDAPGLQLLKRQGDGHAREWTDAPVLPGAFLVIVGDVLERMTNGEWRATPHRVARTAHARNALIRFNAVSATTLVQPLPKFVTAARPPRYSAVTMRTHMETTMQNLADGRGAWDSAKHKSLTATYLYIGGEDHRKVRSGEKKVGLGVRYVH